MTMHDDPTMPPTVTDAAIAAMFERRSRRGDGSGLRDSILTTTAATAQVRRRRLSPGTLVPRRVAYAFVALLLALAAAGLALVASGVLRQDVGPTETAERFVRPFEYAIPADSGLHPVADEPNNRAIAWVVGPDLPPPTPDPVQGSVVPDYGGQRPDSGNTRGVIVASGEKAWSHAGDRFYIEPAPPAFVADLRDRFGVAMGPVVETSLDGRPAVATVLTGASQNDIHVLGPITGLPRGPFVLLDDPARLIVTEVDGTTVFVLIWARTAADLDAWMPVADRFVDSIHFQPQVDPSQP